jgi:hypothetical protein
MSLAMMNVWWNFIDYPLWPFWAIEVKVGVGGYCSSCADHDWIPCDLQDQFYGYAPPQPGEGFIYDAKFKDFVVLGEGAYSQPSLPTDEVVWSEVLTFVPKLSNVIYDDPTAWMPHPNAYWGFSFMTNLEPWEEWNGGWVQDYDFMPDIFVDGSGWEPLCLHHQDIHYGVTTLIYYCWDSWMCPADLDGNGSVNIPDLLILLAHFGLPFDVQDFLAWLTRWGGCPYT